MNVDLLVLVIILYIIKNNNYQYWYAKNKNQNLLLLLLFINERNQCLNNKYYMNYPNHPLDNSTYIKNTSKDTSINNNKDNIINIDKGDAMSKNNKNSNRVILKNKYIKTTTKIHNKSNNSRQFRYSKNRNHTLLLLLLLINEKNNYTSIDTNKNITKNTSKDTSKNNNKDNIINSDKSDTISKSNDSSIDPNNNNNVVATTINKNKDNLINSNKPISKNTAKDDIVNIDNNITINTNTDIPIKDNSNCIKNTNKTTSINNNEDNIINSDKSDTLNKSNDRPIDTNKNSNDEDTNIITNNDSNPANFKNKFIKAATKIHNESSTYKNPCQKNNNISISNTFKQLPLSQINTDISEFTKNFNLKIPAPLTDVKAKVPVLVSSTNITELFHGKVTFCKPIISILKVTNEVFITSKSVLPTLHTNANNAVLHYEGFLKTQLEYLEDVIIEDYQIKCDSKYYIMLIPFSGSKELNFADEIINSPNIVLSDFALDINKSTFSVDTCLEVPVKGNEYINLYKICNLTVKVDCDLSLYRKKLVQL